MCFIPIGSRLSTETLVWHGRTVMWCYGFIPIGSRLSTETHGQEGAYLDIV